MRTLLEPCSHFCSGTSTLASCSQLCVSLPRSCSLTSYSRLKLPKVGSFKPWRLANQLVIYQNIPLSLPYTLLPSWLLNIYQCTTASNDFKPIKNLPAANFLFGCAFCATLSKLLRFLLPVILWLCDTCTEIYNFYFCFYTHNVHIVTELCMINENHYLIHEF